MSHKYFIQGIHGYITLFTNRFEPPPSKVCFHSEISEDIKRTNLNNLFSSVAVFGGFQCKSLITIMHAFPPFSQLPVMI